jgi:hypothetical protein
MEHQSMAQWLSFVTSIANIAHAVASVDYLFDTSAIALQNRCCTDAIRLWRREID